MAGIDTEPIVMTIDQLSREGATQLADAAIRIGALEASMRRSQRSSNWVQLEITFPALHDDVAASLLSLVRFAAEAPGGSLKDVIAAALGR